MRGTKAKQLRKEALCLTRLGRGLAVRRPAQGQVISQPFRYLYQALKGRTSVQLLTP